MNTNMVPKASPDVLPELAAFLEPFASLFRRHTSRDSMERYITGLLTDLPHKTADTIAAAVAGTSTERLQHLLTDAAWDAQALDEARTKLLLASHPPTAGILVLDETGLPKKGTESVGVAAQYAGTLGKIGNCQVVVSAQYLADDPASSTPFHFPVTAQLFLPESWIADSKRQKLTHVPAELRPQTQPEIALAHARWVIEQFYEDAKQECGLDDFQGRSFDGLHRHLALVMLAYSFLMLQRLALPLPAEEAFPPLSHAKLPASRASADAALALPGSRPLAYPDRSD